MSDEELLAWLPSMKIDLFASYIILVSINNDDGTTTTTTELDENDRAAFNVTQAMVSAGVTFGTSDAFDDGAKLLSISQRRLVRAFLTAAAARWSPCALCRSCSVIFLVSRQSSDDLSSLSTTTKCNEPLNSTGRCETRALQGNSLATAYYCRLKKFCYLVIMRCVCCRGSPN